MDLNSITDEVNKYIPVWRLRQGMEAATNYVMNYTEPEAKVREATNEDAWGPTGPILAELVEYSHRYTTFGEMMGMLWQRMSQDNQGAWRRVYKSLLVIEHLVKNGSDRCVTSAKDHLYDIRSLQHYQCIDHKGVDQGKSIRHRATQIVQLLSDDDNIRQARHTARENAKKFGGSGGSVSNFGGMGSHSGGYGGRSSSHYDSYGGGSSRSGGDSYYDRPPSAGFDSPKKSGNSAGGGLGGWDGNEDDDGTGGVVKDATPAATTTAAATTNDLFDWDAAPSQPANKAPKTTSFEDNRTLTVSYGSDSGSQNAHIPKNNVPKKSVPRKLVSLGAAAGYQAASGSSAAAKPAQTNADLLGGLGGFGGAPAPAATTSNNDWDPFASSSNQPATQNTAQNNADPFGDWMGTSSTTPATTATAPASNNTFDPFASLSSATPTTTTTPAAANSASHNLNDLFGSLSTGPTSTTPKATNLMQPSNTMSGIAASKPQPTNQSSNVNISNKLSSSSTWAGIGNLDDLVNMSSSNNKPKQSMNAMKTSNNTTTPASNLSNLNSLMTPSSSVLTPTTAAGSSVLQPSVNSSGNANIKTDNNDQFAGFF